MTQFTIRPERDSDHDQISAITLAAFATVPYGDGNEADIIHGLRGAGDLIWSFVAEAPDGQIIGQISISPAAVGDDTTGWYGIGPIAVRPDHVKQGIGTALMNEGLSAMTKAGAKGVILAGDPAYYSRFGFRNDTGATYLDVPQIYVHKLVLNGPDAHGALSFAPALHGA